MNAANSIIKLILFGIVSLLVLSARAENSECGRWGSERICSYNEALKLLRKEIEQGNPNAVENYKQATKDFPEIIKRYKVTIKKALADGNLVIALDANNRILSIDDEDPDAMSFYDHKAADIVAFMRALLEKASQICRNGKREDSIKIIRLGIQLDSQDPIGLDAVLQKLEENKDYCP